MIDNPYISTTKNNKYVLTEEGIQHFMNVIINGSDSYSKWSTLLQVDNDTFRNMCHRDLGVKKDNRRKYSVNENYFEIIDSNEKAYWLGFLCADGYVSEKRNKIHITLQPQDYDHLVKFAKSINSQHPITPIVSTLNGKEYSQFRISIGSDKMVDDLVKLGCYPNKSLTLLPPNISDEFVLDWILGYWDGDGGICSFGENRYTSYFTGTYEVISFIKEKLNLTSSIYKEHRCVNNTYGIKLTEGPTNRFLDKAYTKENEHYVLSRKRDKYYIVRKPLD